MTVAAVAKGSTTREVALADWGKILLEELLFRGAMQASDGGPKEGSVSVTLTFRLAPDVDDNCIKITMDGAVDSAIATRLPMHAGPR